MIHRNFNDKIEIAKRNDIFDATSVSNMPNINMEKTPCCTSRASILYC